MPHGVTSGFEAREHDRSYAGKGSAGRAAYGSEDSAGYYADYAKSAPDMSHKDVYHVNKLLGDATSLHDPASKYEHRYGYQGDGVHLGETVGQKLCCLVTDLIHPAEEYQPGA